MTDQPATGDLFVEDEDRAKGHDHPHPAGVPSGQGGPVLIGSADLSAGRLRLDQEQRARLGRLADCLIAGGSGLPSASAVDVHGAWIDRAVAARPDLALVVQSVVAQGGEPQEVLDRVRAEEPILFGDFALAVSGAYLINPRIRKLLGYPAAAPAKNPAFDDEADAYLEDGILDAVINRGPIFRPTPPAEPTTLEKE